MESFLVQSALSNTAIIEPFSQMLSQTLGALHPVLMQDDESVEAPEDPTGQAPESLEELDTQGSKFWCNPEIEDCGWATWGNRISPELGFKIYFGIALWQVAVTSTIYDRTVNTRLFVDGEFNTDPYWIDYMWLGMCLWHLPVYGTLALSGAALQGVSVPWIEAVFLTFSNVSMLGILGIFEVIFLGLIAAA
jgi:hypothetical protein